MNMKKGGSPTVIRKEFWNFFFRIENSMFLEQLYQEFSEQNFKFFCCCFIKKKNIKKIYSHKKWMNEHEQITIRIDLKKTHKLDINESNDDENDIWFFSKKKINQIDKEEHSNRFEWWMKMQALYVSVCVCMSCGCFFFSKKINWLQVRYIHIYFIMNKPFVWNKVEDVEEEEEEEKK